MYTILIVDDEKVERGGMVMLIKRLGLPLKADIAENGEIALGMLERMHYDLLLTDIKMPFMDGLTLAHRARELYPELVVLIFSAYGDFEKAQVAIREHVYHYLLKPVNLHEFESVMKACLEEMEKRRSEAAEKATLESKVSGYRRMEALLRGQMGDQDAIARDELIRVLDHDAPKPNNFESASNPIVRKMLDIVHAEYGCEISIETVASRLCLTPNYLSTLFSRQMGISYVKYLNSFRLDQAAKLLLESNLKIVDIAAQTGFPSDSYFVTLFKLRFGLTPTAYRARL